MLPLWADRVQHRAAEPPAKRTMSATLLTDSAPTCSATPPGFLAGLPLASALAALELLVETGRAVETATGVRPAEIVSF